MKKEQKCHKLFAPCCDTLKCVNGVCNENGKTFGNTSSVVIQKVTTFITVYMKYCDLHLQYRFQTRRTRRMPTQMLLWPWNAHRMLRGGTRESGGFTPQWDASYYSRSAKRQVSSIWIHDARLQKDLYSRYSTPQKYIWSRNFLMGYTYWMIIIS